MGTYTADRRWNNGKYILFYKQNLDRLSNGTNVFCVLCFKKMEEAEASYIFTPG